MHWLPQLCRHQVDPGVRAWLACRGSLTARLRAHFPALRVQLLRQLVARPEDDEYAWLGLRAPRLAWVREVCLCDADRPLVFAHSVTPLADRGAGALLARLGARPLGEVLFADPLVRRGPLQFCRLDHRHPLYRRAALSGAAWARRSRFVLSGHPLLVSEVFLPALHASLPRAT
jgi:chorismate--pyruvate lyase